MPKEIVDRAEAFTFDLDFPTVRAWREKTGGKVVGHLPIYVPRELIHAAGMLPVGIFGGGDRVEIIRGDAYFQSYICHIPRSTIELLMTERYDIIDGFLFPSICDVIRNLSGMFKMMAPEKLVRYVDVPQNFDPEIGGKFYQGELRSLSEALGELSGTPVTEKALTHSIALYNENRSVLEELSVLRKSTPWLAPASEVYVVVRAGSVIPVEEHTALLREYLAAIRASDRHEMDLARVVVTGSFCEQPPLALIKTLERAGCYVVDDDFMHGMRWIKGDISTEIEPYLALSTAYLESSRCSAARYIDNDEKGRELVETVRESHSEGVIFCAPSFCDPALLDQPMQAAAINRAEIQHTSFKYSENTGQYAVIREQAGTFADSIRLWSDSE